MFSKDRWNEILEALNANRFRTFLTENPIKDCLKDDTSTLKQKILLL